MLGRYFRPAYLKAIPDQASLVAVITGDADRRMIIPVLDRLPQHSLGLAINVEVYYSKGCHNSLDHKKHARIEMLLARKRVWTRARALVACVSALALWHRNLNTLRSIDDDPHIHPNLSESSPLKMLLISSPRR